jgi:S1-C subfamily serine protease
MYYLTYVCTVAIFLIPTHLPAQTKPKISSRKQGPASDLPEPNFKKCEALLTKSVVRIQTTAAIGSGFSVGDGTLVVTNDHVVRNNRSQKVQDELTIKLTDGTTRKAKVVLTMPHRDLAALRIQQPVPPLLLAQEDQFLYQTPVMVFGHGEGVDNLQNTGKLTDLSEWSAWNMRAPNLVFANDTLLLKTDATVHPGHSGSPLVTPDGLIVGAMTFIEQSDAQGNLAIHVAHIRELVGKADPRMKLLAGKLSGVERIRNDRLRRLEALTQLAEQHKSSSRNGVIDASPLRMFFQYHNAAIRGF